MLATFVRYFAQKVPTLRNPFERLVMWPLPYKFKKPPYLTETFLETTNVL